MKKIPSVFKRDYDGDRLFTREAVPEAAWVLEGEGRATVKIDGTCCLVRNGKLYKRFDRKVTKTAKRRGAPYTEADCKPAPPNWEPCEGKPNEHTGHWPGWIPVGDGPEDKWHREAFSDPGMANGTYELIGPRVQGNPQNITHHRLVMHGASKVAPLDLSFQGIKDAVAALDAEGIVWHHPDGRMAKVKRKDFGFLWPVPKEES